MSVEEPENVAANDVFERFAQAGFERLGIEADATMLALMAVADALYRPYLSALLEADLAEAPLDRERDMSKPPAEPEAW